MGLHCSGISCPNVFFVGGIHYGSATVRGGGRTRLVGFVGTDDTGLLPEAGNVPTAEHVDGGCDTAVNSLGFFVLGSPNEVFNIENEPEDDA